MDNKEFYLKDRFIESPIYDNWFKMHYPQESLLICSPYIKKDALDKVISLYNLNKRKEKIDLKVLIRGNVNEFTYQKSSDISIFDSLLCLQGFERENVRRITNLHMKAYLVDGRHLLITSGNLTNSGMFVVSGKENFEGGISTNDPRVILPFLRYFTGIWNQGEALESFYDELMSAYAAYIENGYSDERTLQRLRRRRYNFKITTSFEGIEAFAAEHREQEKAADKELGTRPSLDDIISGADEIFRSEEETQTFSLSDIPPVGTLAHIPEVLRIVNEYPEGISYLELGRLLRSIFSGSESDTDNTNRKFGEEKGKFAAFLDLVYIEDSGRGKLVKISNLGKTYMSINDEAKNKLIKDVFFDKPIIVSIMRQSLETADFDLLSFLLKNCEGATSSTLARKVGPLKELFAHISSICTAEELQRALRRV